MSETSTSVPASFKQLDVPLPPMLLQTARVNVDSRFISLYYWGSKATWSDGRSSATFPYFAVFQPYTEHLSIAVDLFPYHLGSDDEYPTHALLCDRAQQRVYAGAWEKVEQFCDSQHPPKRPVTPQEWEDIKLQIAKQSPLDMSKMQDLGMLEMFLPPKPELRENTQRLVQWLDQFVDEALITKYLEAARAGDYRAVIQLERFKRRFQEP